MQRTFAAAAAAALTLSALAFAPATDTSTLAEPTHEVTFTESGSQTIQGGMPGGVNVTPFNVLADQECTDNPDGYCETILIEVVQPIADEDPDAFEQGGGSLTIETTADVQGSDFDLYLYASDANGSLGELLGSSGNFSACSTYCGVPVVHSVACPASDECVTVELVTNELVSTRYVLAEIYYFASPAGHTTDLTYTRQDGRNADGTTGTPATAGGAADAPATSAEAVDVTSGYEPAGDWNGGGEGQDVGSALGQDIAAGFIAYGDDTFTFTIETTELLPAGGTPEATRYGWSFAYNGNEFELDGKFTNYSRGACDPTAGSCPPVRDPGVGYFSLRGNCVTSTDGANLTLCEELGGVNATFDPATATITIPIPAAVLAPEGVAACDSITGSASFIGQSIWAASSAFVTSSAFPFDDAMHYVPLVVPYADADLSC